MSYIGYISTGVGKIRSVRTTTGHSLDVLHQPREGLYHVEVGIRKAAGLNLKKAEKGHLREQLGTALSELVPHNRTKPRRAA